MDRETFQKKLNKQRAQELTDRIMHKNDHFKTDQHGNRYAGDHILLDLYGADYLCDPDYIEQEMKKAAKFSGATIIGSQFKKFGENGGVSGFLLLAESHISIHTWPENGTAQIDVFMCGDCNTNIAVNSLIHSFRASSFKANHEKRGFAENSKHWGQHLILDLKGCPESLLKHPPTIRGWCAALVAGIEMKAHGDPIVEYFAEHSEEAAGYTLVQLIETSNICAHFAENTGDAYIDIFSCKEFDEHKAMAITESYFHPKITEIRSIKRG